MEKTKQIFEALREKDYHTAQTAIKEAIEEKIEMRREMAVMEEGKVMGLSTENETVVGEQE